nr:HAD family hydrolase [Anaerolineae bacterium]
MAGGGDGRASGNPRRRVGRAGRRPRRGAQPGRGHRRRPPGRSPDCFTALCPAGGTALPRYRLAHRRGYAGRDVGFVVASFDRTFDYRKLQIAFDAIRAGARLIATNADRYCPTPTGGLPDAAAVIGAIEGCTGKRVEGVVGKPSPITARAILAHLQLPASECIIVGDRLETDIRMGQEAGMATAVVLTGVTTPESLAASDIQPDYVLRGLDELLPP